MSEKYTDWQYSALGGHLFSVRHQKGISGAGARVSLGVAFEEGGLIGSLLISSESYLSCEFKDGIAPSLPDNMEWEDANYLVLRKPGDNEEVRKLYHKLWTAAPESSYDKKDWLRLGKALSLAGYKL